MASPIEQTDLERPVLAWLAAEAAAGSRTALHRLLERLRHPLIGFLAHAMNDRDEVQDAWQETALAISAGIGQLKDTSTVRGWAFRIARNKITDAYRRRDRLSEAFDDTLHAPSLPPSDRLALIAELIRKLSAADQHLIYGFYHLGLSLSELAQALDITPGATRVRLFRARARLKTMLEGDPP